MEAVEGVALELYGRYDCCLVMTRNKADVAVETLADSRKRITELGMSRGQAASLLILGLLVATSYLPAMWAGFVWDDEIIRRIDAVRSWGGI